MGEIISACADGVLELRFNRPEKKNALTQAMYRTLVDELRQAEVDDEIKAVVLTAAGSDFCAGNDIQDFARDLPAFQASGGATEDLPVFQFLKCLTFFEKPLIAAVKGKAAGVGVTLLLHCDLVVVADDIALTLPFLKLGLVPEAGSTLLLPQRIGHARTFAWMALGEAVGAEAARDLGLANRVVPAGDLAASAAEMAKTVAALPAEAVRHTKAFLRDPDVTWQVVRAEAEVFRTLLFSTEAQAAFAAFLAR
ncbi:MAG TPA: enoyl-CoA hydratase-related protein [Asticcacaulis sp.]|nr:enoyl-CoA hydratase-related protein [Asticcacaulis sp.]